MTLQSLQGGHTGISQVFVPKNHFTNIRGINPVMLVAFCTENFGLFLLII